MLRLLLADDHEIVRRGARAIISQNPAWVVVGEAQDGETALKLALDLRPDIAVLDVSLPHMNGVTVTRRLKQEAPGISVLLFTMRDDDRTVNEGLIAGARGYVLKSDTQHHLGAAIAALEARRPYFSPWVTQLLIDGLVRNGRSALSPALTVREREVARLICEGRHNKQIASDLSISIKTVESHRASAMRKAGVKTAGDLVRFAVRQGLIQA